MMHVPCHKIASTGIFTKSQLKQYDNVKLWEWNESQTFQLFSEEVGQFGLPIVAEEKTSMIASFIAGPT
jgi:hypothetical protein